MARVFACRLEEVSESQCALVKGKQIIDCLLIANEIVEDMQKKGRDGVLCQLDMGKAYDHVNWRFLDNVMGMMGLTESGKIG